MQRNGYIESGAIDFAKNHDRIIAVSVGNCPEESGLRTYYFIIRDGYYRERADAISKLELDLFGKVPNETFIFAEWPSRDVDKTVKDYPFLGEIIWRRS